VNFQIGRNEIGRGHSTFIIAEMSANHGQDLQKAKDIVHAMKESGADAIKLQTYDPRTMTIDCDRPEFIIGAGTLWEGQNLYDLYKNAYTPWEWHNQLFELANSLGMDCFSTPFDNSAVDFLEELDPPAYKVASFEMADIPLVEYIASKGRPIIMSTGMATLEEIHRSVKAVKKYDAPLAVLKCTSAYPSPPEEMNLSRIPHMIQTFQVPTGLSDHTLGIAAPVVAVSFGACIIEKHFTLSRKDPGPDSAFSLEPNEFKAMVEAVRVAEKAMGNVTYELTEKESASRSFRRSLFVVEDIQRGETFTDKNVRSIRPGDGMPPAELPNVLGRKASADLSRGTPLMENHIG
jgi:pseudaminic acid synthase